MIALAMLHAALLGALVAAAALVAERTALLVGRPARGVWAAALVASVALPALAGRQARRAERSPAPAPAAAPAPVDGAVAARWAALLARIAPPTGGEGADAVLARVGERLRPLDRPLLLLWGAASVAGVAWLAAGHRRLRRLAARWPARRVGRAVVHLAPDAAGPAAFPTAGGRGRVVLPRWLLADPRRALVVAHEGEHLRAGDPLLLAGATLLAVLVPWSPAVWWQLARLRAAVELDCDRRVLARHRDVRRYGTLLLDVAARAAASPPLRPALGLAAIRLAPPPTTTLHRRIHRMTTPPPRHAARRALLPAALTAALATVAVALPAPAAQAPAAQAPAAQAPATRPAAAQPRSATPRPTRVTVTTADSTVRVARFTTTDTAGRPTGDTLTVPLLARTTSVDRALYVVDGRILPPPPGRTHADGPPAGLPDPSHIASVNVLKGEAAVRRYGARGRDGVVEITTKKAGAAPR